MQASYNEEEKVIHELFLKDSSKTEAQKIVRPPGANGTLSAVKVSLSYTPITITNFDETTGYIYLHFWERAVSELYKDAQLYISLCHFNETSYYIM